MRPRRLAALFATVGVLGAAVSAYGARAYGELTGTEGERAVPGAAVGTPGAAVTAPEAALADRTTVPVRLAGETRTAKARLIQQLQDPPQVVVFGGSRAMRFDPAYIRRLTGHTAFNAAVTQARPEDTWALLSLLHARFPRASFRFLWVVHGDEFIRRRLDTAILLNPALSRYFPPALADARRVRARVRARTRAPAQTRAPARTPALARTRALARTVQIGLPKRGRLAYAPDGYVLRGFFSNGSPPPHGHPAAIAANITKELHVYARSRVAPYLRSIRYFKKDLRLMDSISAGPPVVVAAPFDGRIYAATLHRGWGARHRRIRALLGRLHRSYGFAFLDLSRAWAHGFTPSDFYDGIHLTPQGARRVVNRVLRRFPQAL